MNMAINDMELDNVTGGATRTVKNNSLKYTGNKIKKDGYVWYEITLENGSDNAWIAGSLIGY